MTDPNTIPPLTPQTPTAPADPQELIDQALNVETPPTTPSAPAEQKPSETPAPEMSVTPPVATEPTMGSSVETPSVEIKGEDVPLALATAPTDAPVVESAPPVELKPEPMPEVPPAPASAVTAGGSEPKPKKTGKIIAMIVGFFVLIGIVGVAAYSYFGDAVTIAGVTIGKNGRPSTIEDPGDCNGESNGGWLVWRNGECKVTGISGSADKNDDGVGDKDTTNPNLAIDAQKLNNKEACNGSGKGYVWCESVDSSNKSYAFCNTSGKGCNQAAIDKGYSIRVGVLKCKQVGGQWVLDDEYYNSNQGDGAQSASEVIDAYNDIIGTPDKAPSVDPCSKTYAPKNGTEKYICKEGVVGEGTASQPGIPYTGGACTALNGKKFTGNLGCFCGTVQIDTDHGHQSYSSTCGCDKEGKTTTLVGPSLQCSSLSRTPTTTPTVGSVLTFTCAGASTPAGSVNLSYKFRYSLNSGAYINLNNATATTTSMTIAACGNYKVQCQACGTINGVLTCDPVWAAATTQ